MELTVIKSTQGKKGFVNTLEAISKIKIFGVEKTTSHRFLMKTDAALPIGAKENVDMSQFTQNTLTQVQAQDSQFGRDVVTNAGVVRVSSTVWLHSKVEA